MNSENFHEYLKNPSMLYQISYQELKSLAMQYPYSPNLRCLMLVKSLVDGNKDYERNLALAALHSLDRRKLHRQVKQHARMREIHENYHLAEDFLELKDLSTLEEVLKSQPVRTEQAPPQQQAAELFDLESLTPPAGQDQRGFFEKEDEESLPFLENLVENESPTEQPAHFEEPGEPSADAGDSSHAVEEPASETPSLEDLLEEMPEENPFHEEMPGEAVQPAFEEEAASEPLENTTLEELGAATGAPAGMEEAPDEWWEELEAEAPERLAEAGFPEVPDEPQAEELEAEAPAEEPQLPHDAKDIPFEITNDEESQAAAPQPAPKTSFNSWLRQFQPPQPSELSVHLRGAPPSPKPALPPEDTAKSFAAKSLAEDFGIASETLAALLVGQGHYQRAIAMYERLRLLHPEKNGFFAAKIEELKFK